jgi:hypothetical protein
VIFRADGEAAWNIFQGLARPNLEQAASVAARVTPLMAFLLPASQTSSPLMRRPRLWLAALAGLGLLAILIQLGERNVHGFAYYRF